MRTPSGNTVEGPLQFVKTQVGRSLASLSTRENPVERTRPWQAASGGAIGQLVALTKNSLAEICHGNIL
jgi:hypothetical protein